MINIDHILKFTEFLTAFREVDRMVWSTGKDRVENDVEHSYSLAMLAWYINDAAKLNLDTHKLFKYALAHDMVEVYSGDVWFYQTDQNVINNKQAKEHEAALKITEQFKEFPELSEVIEMYEKREDKESKFIYALDKLEPMLNIYLDKGRTWQKNGITLEKAKAMKIPKVKIDPDIDKYFHELLKLLEVDEHILFAKPDQA